MYESLQKYNPNGIISLGLDGTVLGANPAYEQIVGYSLDELRQINVVEQIVYPQNWEWVRSKFTYSVAENIEMQIRHKSGHLLDVLVSSVPIIIKGKQTGVHFVVQDITKEKQLQRQLEETQRLYRLISENSQDVISYISPDGKFGYVSPSVKPLLGYDPEELVGKSNEIMIHEDDLPYVRQVGNRIQGGEDVTRFTCRVRCKTGNYRWYETTLRVVRESDGMVTQIVGVGRDISEQMNLQESFEHAVRIAKLGHWDRCLKTETLVYSDQMYRILGIEPRKNFTHQEFYTFIHPEDLEVLVWSSKRSIETGQPFDRVYRIVRRDGSIRHVHSQGEVLFDDSGVPSRMLGTVQDITEQKVLEMELFQTEQRYRKLVENSFDAIGIFENGKWVYMNRVGLEMFGVNHEDEIIGHDYLDFIDPKHHAESENRLEAILSQKQLKPVEYKWTRKNGEVFYAEALGSPFGENAVQVYIRDITDRKKTDELLLRSEKLTAVGQLAAGVAHEIKNPLTALKGFTKMLQEKSAGANPEYFKIMNGELDRIEMILSEMLMLAKPQATKFRPQQPNLILGEVITLLSTQAVMKNVVIHTDFADNLPAVLGNASQLKQVFINVVKNGIESMPAGGNLYVQLRTLNQKMFIEIKDEGEGIPQDRLPKLGEPFFSTKEGGTGLGLMVCQKIISNHHGQIAFWSEVGVGTTVTISLPTQADLVPVAESQFELTYPK